MDGTWVQFGLGLALHGLTALLLVVLSLHLLELAGQSLDLILVLVDLSLVHVEFGSHGFHLVGLLLQVLLVDGKLFGNLRTWLSGQEVLEFDVELFLLLDGHVLLDDLLSFLDQTLLEGLDLEQELKGVRVRTLKLSPSVVVEWVLKLFGKGLDLKALFLKCVAETEHLFLVLSDFRRLGFLNLELTLVLTDLVTEKLDILKPLVVLNFTLSERDLQNLDLLVKESQLVISADQLSSQNIPLSHE